MNNKLLFLGVSLLGLIPATFIYNHMKSNSKLIQRKTMVEILLTMKRRYYPILKQIAFMVQKIKHDTKFKDEEIAELVMGADKPSSMVLKKIDKEILSFFKVTEQEFKYSYRTYKDEDVEIRLLIQEMKVEISMATRGNLKEYKGHIPQSLTSSKTLKIFVEMIKIQMTQQIKIYKDTLLNPQNQDQLYDYDEIVESSELEEYLRSQEIESENEHPGKVVNQAIQNYLRRDPEFKERILAAKAKFEAISNKVLEVKVTIRANKPVDLKFLDTLIEEIECTTI